MLCDFYGCREEASHKSHIMMKNEYWACEGHANELRKLLRMFDRELLELVQRYDRKITEGKEGP